MLFLILEFFVFFIAFKLFNKSSKCEEDPFLLHPVRIWVTIYQKYLKRA